MTGEREVTRHFCFRRQRSGWRRPLLQPASRKRSFLLNVVFVEGVQGEQMKS